MEKKNILTYSGLGIICLAAIFFFTFYNQGVFGSSKDLESETNSSPETEKEETEPKIIPDKQKKIKIRKGTTFGELMKEEGGLSRTLVNEIYNLAKGKYNLAKIKTGNKLELTYHKNTNNLKKLLYKINSEEQLTVSKNKNKNWEAQVADIPYKIKTEVKEAGVETSLYQSALDNGIDERIIINLANAFQWTIDFVMDTRKGDEFKVIYENRYLNGEYVMPGKVLAAKYKKTNGDDYEVYYFEENEENKGYFDKEGNSVQKIFLKAPVAFKYISSGYTTGLRYVEAFNTSTGHKAIDYAAKIGTPVRTVGDGTVTYAGYNGGYGNIVKLRHNGTYSTNYAHLSRFAVRYGSKVKQGDIIGYVGSTGFSTGPHLHYEMVKNGVKINPLTEILPPGEAIKPENKDRFFNHISNWQKTLNQ